MEVVSSAKAMEEKAEAAEDEEGKEEQCIGYQSANHVAVLLL